VVAVVVWDEATVFVVEMESKVVVDVEDPPAVGEIEGAEVTDDVVEAPDVT